MKIRSAVGPVVLVAGIADAAFLSRNYWAGGFPTRKGPPASEPAAAPIQEAKTLKMTEQARKNLGLVSKVAKPQEYWRTIEVPGEIVDRPGYSDRGGHHPPSVSLRKCMPFPEIP